MSVVELQTVQSSNKVVVAAVDCFVLHHFSTERNECAGAIATKNQFDVLAFCSSSCAVCDLNVLAWQGAVRMTLSLVLCACLIPLPRTHFGTSP
eukprot:6176080-Amphidinium_carterae.3